MNERVFTYGTLLLPDVMQAVTGQSFPSEEAVLYDYIRFQVRDKVYPGIIPARGARVTGRLYSGTDPLALLLLDRFEGDLYERRVVQVITATGTSLDAYAYVIAPMHRRSLSTQAWSVSRFVRLHAPAYRRACRQFYQREIDKAKAQLANA